MTTKTNLNTQLFISYSRVNLEIVNKLRDDLINADIDVWIDHVGLTPGTANWDQALRDAIGQARAVIFVASPIARRSDYVQDELAIARGANKPIYPVWVDGDDWMDCVPMGLGHTQNVDLRGENYSENLPRLISSLGGTTDVPETIEPLIPSSKPETKALSTEPRNPYKGLKAFREKDKGDFFGRDTLIAELISKFQFEENQPRFLAVVGASGSGKSSVIMAGLLPALKAGAINKSENWHYLEPMVPGNTPLENLTIVLTDAVSYIPTDIRRELDNPNTRGLHTLAKQVARQSRLVLYIDQFEELFTLTTNEDERRQFIDVLTTAVTELDGALIVILSIRADFYDRPLEYNILGHLVKEQAVPVLPLTLSDLYDVIEKPAQLNDVQITFEDGLVTDILFAVRDEIGALPLLQFTLDQLFQKRDGQLLTQSAYDDIGGVRGALAKHAEQTYLNLPSAEHQGMARALFLRLIEPGTTEQDTTRRRAEQSELTLPDEDDTHILQETATIFVDNRLLVSQEDTVEVAHEALIREWKRLTIWLRDAREDLRLQKSLSEDVAEWQRQSKPTDMLYRGTVLIDAQAWADRNPASRDETMFISASVTADEQQKAKDEATARRVQNFQRASIILGIMVMLAIGATLLAGLSALEASNLKSTAEVNSTQLSEDVEFFGIQQERVGTLAAGGVVIPAQTATLDSIEYIATLTQIAKINALEPIEMTDEFGVLMVQVPPGCFYMGSVAGIDEQPHEQCFLERYWIDKFEVTNAQYREITGQEPPSEFSDDLNPVDSIKWFDARDYCRIREAELPTEAQWEYAARGADSLTYPWGNEFHANVVVYNRTLNTGHLPVMDDEGNIMRPEGASWVGAIDMSGNVWEWTNTRYDDLDYSKGNNDFQNLYPYPYATHDGREDDETVSEFKARLPMVTMRVLRGGSFNTTGSGLRGASRLRYLPDNGGKENGFRCAR